MAVTKTIEVDGKELCCCAIATEHDNNPTANIHFILFFMLCSFFNYYKDSIYQLPVY